MRLGMSRIIFILVFLFLTSCCSLTRFSKAENSCLINAINLQIDLKNSKNVKWAKIICVIFTEHGEEFGHAMCFFKMNDDSLWLWDSGGKYKLHETCDEAICVAKQRYINVKQAWYY